MPPSAHQQVVRDWLIKAQYDLDTANRMIQAPERPTIVAFHAQQAAEKALKAFLTFHGVTVSKTHELDPIVRLCMTIDPAFGTLLDAAQALNRYAIEPRYPSAAPDPSAAEAANASREAHSVYDFVLQRLPPEVYP